MSKMLDDLVDHLDEVQRKSPKDYSFLLGLAQRRSKAQAQGEKFQLSIAQFNWLQDLHNKYVCGLSTFKGSTR